MLIINDSKKEKRFFIKIILFVFLFLSFFLFFLNNSVVDAGQADDFVITVKTDNPGTSSNTQFTIPTSGAGYNYNVDCNNDGVNEATAQNGNYTCSYPLAGTYTIRIKDNAGDKTGFPRIYFNNTGDKDKILSVNQWGTGKWTSMAYAFYGCSNLNSATAVNNGGGGVPDWATDVPDLSGVTNMTFMFDGAVNFNQSVNNWNVSNILDMSYMFYNASSFNQPLNNWNTSSVANLKGMFAFSGFNQGLNWDTSSVTDMSYMFDGDTVFNQSLSWDVSSVTDMSYMFYNATSYNRPMNWNTVSVTNMSYMFYNAASYNQPMNWNTVSVTNMSHMFDGASVFDQLLNWDTSSVVNMSYTFHNASSFNHLLDWDVSSVTDMSYMFYNATSYNQPMNWNTSSVIDMSYTFYNASVFNQTLNFNTSSVTNMSHLFYDASSFNKPLNWDVSSVLHMENMFQNASSFNQTLKNWNVTQVTSMNDLFKGTSLSRQNYDETLNGWNTLPLLQNNIQIYSPAHYCTSASARQNIINTYNWTINDAGQDCTPSTPTSAPDLQSSSDLGTSNTDNITSDNTPTFDVQCSEAGNTITLYSDNPAPNTQIGTHNCTGAGSEQITTSVLSDGVHNISYTDTKSGDESGHSPTLAVIIDTITPSQPTVTTPVNNSTLADVTPTFAGTGEVGATVNVTDGTGHSCSATVDATGAWTCNVAPALNDGDTPTFSVTQTDIAGNISAPGVSVAITISITPPTPIPTGKSMPFVCQDPKAINYKAYGINKKSLCKYAEKKEEGREKEKQEVKKQKKEKEQVVKCPVFKNFVYFKNPYNNIITVKKIQIFLKFLGIYKGKITGFYDKNSFEAVKSFQLEYADDILKPWDITKPTGFWYKTTTAKANELLGCNN